jgi:predicted phage terminase large subunit-like protein
MTLSPQGQRAAMLELYRGSFYHFYLKAFSEAKGKLPSMAPYIEAAAHALEQVYLGAISRYALSMPPRCGKSFMCSTVFPAWVLGQDPTAKFMVVSYGQELARELSEGTREIIRMPFYRAIFPNARISPGRDTHTHFRLTEGGERLALSIGGGATGRGADYLIFDDPHKADEALTDNGQERAITAYLNTFGSRFDNPTEGRTIMTHQRLHQFDLIGQVTAKGGWHHMSTPAVAIMDERFALPRGRIWHRRKGDLLHPERLPLAYLAQRRIEMGPRFYEPQYQQDVYAASGGLIDLTAFGQYGERPPRGFFHRIVQSWDTAATDNAHSAFSAGMTWGFRDGVWYLLDVIRLKLRYADLKARMIAWHRLWKADALIIEYAFTGINLYDDIRRLQLPGILRAPTPRGSKEDRVAARSAQIEEGRYLLPASAPWLTDLRRELVSFPNGTSDQVDALTQFLEFIVSKRNWVETRYDHNGRAIRPSRARRESRYYNGDIPSQASS